MTHANKTFGFQSSCKLLELGDRLLRGEFERRSVLQKVWGQTNTVNYKTAVSGCEKDTDL